MHASGGRDPAGAGDAAGNQEMWLDDGGSPDPCDLAGDGVNGNAGHLLAGGQLLGVLHRPARGKEVIRGLFRQERGARECLAMSELCRNVSHSLALARNIIYAAPFAPR